MQEQVSTHLETFFSLLTSQMRSNFVSGFGRDHKIEPVLAGSLAGGGKYFNNIAVSNFSAKGQDATVYLGCNCMQAYICMNRKGKIQRCSASRKLNDIAFWRKDKNLFLEKIEFYRSKKFVGVL